MRKFCLAIFFASLITTGPAFAARCGGDFNAFVAAMSQEAQAAGISQGVISRRSAGVHAGSGGADFRPPPALHLQQDLRAICLDPRRRRPHQWRARDAAASRGAAVAHRGSSSACRRQILVAIWGLETDFGKGDMGKLPVIRTLATMAHDCRRTELFQGELLAALKIVQRGDLPLRDLIGAYAGEIGQTQFLPSSYIKYGVDFDGDGHVDLRHSVPDVLASTANLLHTNGFKMGAPYGEGTREFRGDARVEQGDDLPQDHRVFRRSAGGAVTTVVRSRSSHRPSRARAL